MSIWTDIWAIVAGANATDSGQSPVTAVTNVETQGIFGSLFANLGAGIESGVVALLKDLWTVIAPFVEIAGGVIVFIFAIGLAFKNDLLAIAPIAAGLL